MRVKQLALPDLTKPFSTEVLFGQRVGVIISGGNIDSASYARLLAQA